MRDRKTKSVGKRITEKLVEWTNEGQIVFPYREVMKARVMAEMRPIKKGSI